MKLIQNSLTAIVLAGGQSSRMGQDKALIPIQGVPLLQLVCHMAIGCTDTVYVVTPWQKRYRYLLPANCQFVQEVPLIGEANTTLPHGPLVGFAQGLAQVQTEWVLLLACDLPRLRLEILQEWASGLDLVDDDAIAVLTHHAKGWDPLCGFYRRSCLPKLQEFITRGGRSFQGWLAEHPVQALTLTDSQMLFNCNTPQDLAAVNQLEK